jgi:hypothetical protein
MGEINKIDKSRELLRELQTMLFGDIDSKDLFSKTLEIDNLLNSASIEYNKYLNEKKNN